MAASYNLWLHVKGKETLFHNVAWYFNLYNNRFHSTILVSLSYIHLIGFLILIFCQQSYLKLELHNWITPKSTRLLVTYVPLSWCNSTNWFTLLSNQQTNFVLTYCTFWLHGLLGEDIFFTTTLFLWAINKSMESW